MGGRSRPFREIRTGGSFWRKFKKWMELERIIDRENDWYEKRLTDPETGEVVYECAEPLSKHTGHGSAKFSGKKVSEA